MYVVRPRLVEGSARFALIASLNVGRHIETVERSGKNTGASGFTNSAWSAKQIGLCQMTVFNGIFQRIGYETLSNHCIKRCWSVFPCRYNKITVPHIAISDIHFGSIYVSKY